MTVTRIALFQSRTGIDPEVNATALVDAVEAACKKAPHPECKDIVCDGPAPPFKPKCKDGRCTLTY